MTLFSSYINVPVPFWRCLMISAWCRKRSQDRRSNNSGNLQDTILYDPFGVILSESNPSFGDRYKYTGEEYDAETGLEYNLARYYDSAHGRWTSQDPLGFSAGDSNLYRYVGNQPTGFIDPTGTNKVIIRVPDGEGSGPKAEIAAPQPEVAMAAEARDHCLSRCPRPHRIP
jgi:RHS repeat-associated protein